MGRPFKETRMTDPDLEAPDPDLEPPDDELRCSRRKYDAAVEQCVLAYFDYLKGGDRWAV
jgi:hypothetical protein